MSGDEALKRMADLLRQGATLLDIECPVCHSPIFKLKSGEMYCATCQKIVREEKEVTKTTQGVLMDSLNRTILKKLEELNSLIVAESDQERLAALLKNLAMWLDALERVRRLEKL